MVANLESHIYREVCRQEGRWESYKNLQASVEPAQDELHSPGHGCKHLATWGNWSAAPKEDGMMCLQGFYPA